jgi:hypothetical protein
VPTGVQTVPRLEIFVTRLHESHDVSVYGAIERLMQSGEAVGLDAPTMVRMLDQGVAFEELLGYIESRMECSQRAA